MKRLTAGAWRPASADLRAARTGAADLVQRTLAQHGLAAFADPAQDPSSFSNDVIRDALAQAGLGQAAAGRTARAPVPLPPGASFETASHTGASGARAYRTYIPASAQGGAAGLVVMLHGCTQTPEDFATGTDMNDHAERHRLIVIYPEQSRGANAQSCWNWFSKGDQGRDRGEPEIIAGLTRRAMERHRIAPAQTYVAGLSAGAAMAVILGYAYRDIFAAVGAHSGLPLGAAQDVPSAFSAMAGQAAGRAIAPGPAPRTIVLHGDADRTVHPLNGTAIAQMAETSMQGTTTQVDRPGEAGGRRYRRALTLDQAGQTVSEHWTIEGLGHAWSGGQPGGSHTDPAGPDASAEMIRFFLETAQKDDLT